MSDPSQIFNAVVLTICINVVNAGFAFVVRNECLRNNTVNQFQHAVNMYSQITVTVSTQPAQPRLTRQFPTPTKHLAVATDDVTRMTFHDSPLR